MTPGQLCLCEANHLCGKRGLGFGASYFRLLIKSIQFKEKKKYMHILSYVPFLTTMDSEPLKCSLETIEAMTNYDLSVAINYER